MNNQFRMDNYNLENVNSMINSYGISNMDFNK